MENAQGIGTGTVCAFGIQHMRPSHRSKFKNALKTHLVTHPHARSTGHTNSQPKKLFSIPLPKDYVLIYAKKNVATTHVFAVFCKSANKKSSFILNAAFFHLIWADQAIRQSGQWSALLTIWLFHKAWQEKTFWAMNIREVHRSEIRVLIPYQWHDHSVPHLGTHPCPLNVKECAISACKLYL